MFRSSSSFDRLLEKCTSPLILEPDWSSILAICDSIRSGETGAKYAISGIKKKFYHSNPHIALSALQVMESIVKNCGALVHQEMATQGFMEELREFVKSSSDEKVKEKVLELIQTWGHAFSNSSKYQIVKETLNIMKAEGWKFPPVRESEAMFEADVAPNWADGEVCHRCRTAFGLVTRQHHCRACGQVFCWKCSSKLCVLPKFGIEKEVRVCDTCYDSYGPKELLPSTHGKKDNLPPEYLSSSLAQQSQVPPSSKTTGKSEAEIKEEEELQLAIALSKSEAEEKEKQAKSKSSKSQKNKELFTNNQDKIAPEVLRYLDRDYWEAKEREKETLVPKGLTTTSFDKVNNVSSEEMQRAQYSKVNDLRLYEEDELSNFVTTLKTQLEIFVNRMKSNSSRGRSITNDTSVQTLFMNTMSLHSNLLKFITAQEDKRIYYERLQDKLTQIKDARAALDALREEEKERKRQDAEAAERIRQSQMLEKLELMRQKKQEYLQYQRQMALQRMQEQELMMRQEQMKAQQQTYPTIQPIYTNWSPVGPFYSYESTPPYNMSTLNSSLPPVNVQPPPYNPLMMQMPQSSQTFIQQMPQSSQSNIGLQQQSSMTPQQHSLMTTLSQQPPQQQQSLIVQQQQQQPSMIVQQENQQFPETPSAQLISFD